MQIHSRKTRWVIGKAPVSCSYGVNAASTLGPASCGPGTLPSALLAAIDFAIMNRFAWRAKSTERKYPQWQPQTLSILPPRDVRYRPSSPARVSPPLVERVKGFASKTVVTTSGSPSQLGQPVTFTAKVASTKRTIPDGEVMTFYDRKKVLGSVPLANEQAAYTTSTLSVGKHTIKAAYPGDNTFEPSSGTVQQVVQK